MEEIPPCQHLPKRLSADILLQLNHEGYLQLIPGVTLEQALQQIRQKQLRQSQKEIPGLILAYLSPLLPLVDKSRQPLFRSVWRHILSDPRFIEALMPHANDLHCTTFNKQNVIRILGTMMNKNIFTMNRTDLIRRLEPNNVETYRSTMSKPLKDTDLQDQLQTWLT